MIEREFGVRYNTTYIWQLLRVLGYSAQIPIAVAMEKDNRYVKIWLSEDYPQYVKEAREHDATILFLGESGMQSRPSVRRTWSIRGKRPQMSVKEARDKISIVSAVSEDGELFFAITYESIRDENILRSWYSFSPKSMDSSTSSGTTSQYTGAKTSRNSCSTTMAA